MKKVLGLFVTLGILAYGFGVYFKDVTTLIATLDSASAEQAAQLIAYLCWHVVPPIIFAFMGLAAGWHRSLALPTMLYAGVIFAYTLLIGFLPLMKSGGDPFGTEDNRLLTISFGGAAVALLFSFILFIATRFNRREQA